MRILRTDAELQVPQVDQALRDAGHDLYLLADGVTEHDLIQAAAQADLILMCYTPITRRLIEAAPKLKGIVKYGVGIDAIDITAAKQHGVIVVNIPEYAEDTVAEGAFALMIALAKNLPMINAKMHRDGWAWPEPQWMATDIAAKTVGIVGLGKIGRRMAQMAGAGFRARVVAFDPFVSVQQMNELGVDKYNNLEEMLSVCDFVCIHCVLRPETCHLIGEAELRIMKPSAFLINVSRGAIVDEAALVTALDEGWIAGAGLDVFSQEPLTRTGHPMASLFDHPKVILFPHLTFYTQEAMGRLESETLQRCFEILQGRPVQILSTDDRLANQQGLLVYS